MCFNGTTPNIEPFLIHCVHLLFFVVSNDSALDDGKIDEHCVDVIDTNLFSFSLGATGRVAVP